jgi:NAD+ kinase
VSDLLFTAFSNRVDAIELAQAVGAELAGEGIDSALHLLDGAVEPVVGPDTVVVSLGGDGTFLHAARLAQRVGARVVAVNLGQVGFLLDVAPTDVARTVRGALDGAPVAERLALRIDVEGAVSDEFALNEVVIERHSAGHMVKVRTYVDDEEYLTYSADGVMVATPTGSTGYSLSAGGPVVDPSLTLLIVTPVAPHFTIDRSILVAPGAVIRLEVVDKPAVLVADGRSVAPLEPGQTVTVRRNPRPVRVMAARNFGLASRLRHSLREGHA